MAFLKIKQNIKVLGVILFLILLFAVAIFYIFSPGIMLLKIGENEKTVEFESARITGWDKGEKSFELYSKRGWATVGGNITYFEEVAEGKIFEKGKIIAKNIEAPEVKTFKHSEAIEAYAGGEKKIRLEINLQKEGSSEREARWARISAKELKYVPSEKKVTLAGDLILKRDDMRIIGDRLVSSSPYDVFFIEGNVSVSLPGKVAFSDSAEFSKKDEALTLRGKSKLILEKGKSLIKEEDMKQMKNPETKIALEEKTVIECNELKLFTKNSDSLSQGGVIVTQKDKSAKADQAEYLDQEKNIILTGNVFMNKEGEWIKTKKIIVSIKDETFEAFGGVETEFKLKK